MITDGRLFEFARYVKYDIVNTVVAELLVFHPFARYVKYDIVNTWSFVILFSF